MKVRVLLAGSFSAALLLSGCSPTPDLSQCQAVAALTSEFEAYFAGRGVSPSTEGSNEQLLGLANEYGELEVDGELKAKTATLSSDILDLHEYHQEILDGGAPDAVRVEQLSSTVVSSFADTQTHCQDAG